MAAEVKSMFYVRETPWHGLGTRVEKAPTSEEALRVGLVNQVVPPEELMPTAEKLAGTIARNAPIAVRACKKAVNEGLELDMDAAIALEEKIFGDCFETEDQRSGMAAFLNKEKHPPYQNR